MGADLSAEYVKAWMPRPLYANTLFGTLLVVYTTTLFVRLFQSIFSQTCPRTRLTSLHS